MLESINWSWFLSVIFNLTRFSIHLFVKLLQYLETITYTWACFKQVSARLMCTKNISRKLVGLMLTNTSLRKIFFCKTLRLMVSPIRVVMVLGTRRMKLLTNMIHPWIFYLE